MRLHSSPEKQSSNAFKSAFFLYFTIGLLTLGVTTYLLTLIITNPPREKFLTTAFELTLSDDWHCEKEGGEYVCSPNEIDSKNAIAILALKYRGSQDTLIAYKEYLQKIKTTTLPNGKQMVSQVEYVQYSKIANHTWIDALHFNSEVPNYKTRYLATVTTHVGLAVTFTAQKDLFDKYNVQFEEMIDSLVIHQTR